MRELPQGNKKRAPFTPARLVYYAPAVRRHEFIE
jgi:hypothetical protein